MATAKTLRLVLGDQLSRDLSALRGLDPACDLVVMAEVHAEATHVRHHVRKIAFLFAAMRHFAEALRREGIEVRYTRLDDAENTGSLQGEVARASAATGAEALIVTRPGEYRLDQEMAGWQPALGIPVERREDDRFLCSLEEFAAWAKARKSLRMEFFYREMRQRTGLLMQAGAPVGGQWNYDVDNRKPPPAKADPPAPHETRPDAITAEVLDLVDAHFGDHFGQLRPFNLAVTRDGALQALDHFIAEALPGFGDYQDAMITGQPFLWHSVLAVYLNAGLLGPLEVCRAAEQAWRDGAAPLNAVEGFIRQIIGWREYVRGLYWLKMPDYAGLNALEADRTLPEFYWTGETDLACIADAVTQTRTHAYAHHIQRLMVLGNFALLAGVHPDEINEWFLIVYADAYEWVQLPNTHGMAIFADGGIMASKPYAASGKYIDRMSNYCRGCRYSVKNTVEENACPFNALYWDFLARNRRKFANNPRMAMMYRTYDRFDDGKRQAIAARAGAIRDRLAPVRRQEAA